MKEIQKFLSARHLQPSSSSFWPSYSVSTPLQPPDVCLTAPHILHMQALDYNG